MKFGIFYEHQLPRPWAAGDEHKLLKDALDQVALADGLGIDYLWEVEHHFLEEYSHSSAPEVFPPAPPNASPRSTSSRTGGSTSAPARPRRRLSWAGSSSTGRRSAPSGPRRSTP